VWVSIGKKFDIDPASWRIVNKKLYVNLNPAILEKWAADANDNIQKAEKFWPQIRTKAASDLLQLECGGQNWNLVHRTCPN